MKRSYLSFVRLQLALAVLITPGLAHAHVGVGNTHGFLAGVLHPLTGMDHLCAMLAVGLWAAQLTSQANVFKTPGLRHAIWGVPLAFVTAMCVGSLFAIAGFALPFVEEGIVVSLLALGVCIALSVRIPLAASMALVGLFALFHGHAHGAEIPSSASGFSYAGGFVLTTTLLHVAGIGGGRWLQATARPALIRLTGALIATFGGILWCAPGLSG